MRPQFFRAFYESPNSLVRKPLNKVLRNISSRSYIITPKVMDYVKNHFGCNDDVGALLEE